MQPVQPAGGAESGLVEVRYRRGRDPFGRGGGESVEVVSTTIGISAGVPRRVGGAQAAVGVSVFMPPTKHGSVPRWRHQRDLSESSCTETR